MSTKLPINRRNQVDRKEAIRAKDALICVKKRCLAIETSLNTNLKMLLSELLPTKE